VSRDKKKKKATVCRKAVGNESRPRRRHSRPSMPPTGKVTQERLPAPTGRSAEGQGLQDPRGRGIGGGTSRKGHKKARCERRAGS